MQNHLGLWITAATGLLATVAHADWKPSANTMLTTWGEKLDPAKVWQEYPRPEMKRDAWTNLNGLWSYAVTTTDATAPGPWQGQILVPFAIEAPLSGVGRKLGENEALWYRRTFEAKDLAGGRLLLNFEAVDYKAEVSVNGTVVGKHTGGNLPFSFDVTSAVKAGENELVVRVLDATDKVGAYQTTGKQSSNNKGIWYTSVSGIWQTVWLETVPVDSIDALKIETKMSGKVTITPTLHGHGKLRSTASLNGKAVGSGENEIQISNPQLWSPESPVLYDLKVELLDDSGKVVDAVTTYTGLRETGKAKDAQGNWRFTLNGKPVFHYGPLDQGWWPDGLLTPPSEEAMVSDLKFLKAAGFNMVRKHIKVEPRRYYYDCDKLGLLVWQDQVASGKGNDPQVSPKWRHLDPNLGKKKAPAQGEPLNAEWPDAAHEQWMAELKGMIDHLYNHPSIVVWTPFNERWGQHRTMAVGEWITKYDPSRRINIASGGNFFPVGDIADEHHYPHPDYPFGVAPYNDYIKVVGEFGGHGWPVEGHLWEQSAKKFVYGEMPKSLQEYEGRYAESMRVLAGLRDKGLSAGVYTQTTDVESELNGLMTYDRKVIKIPAAKLKAIHEQNGLPGKS